MSRLETVSVLQGHIANEEVYLTKFRREKTPVRDVAG
jgi:hypothetical protein